jgi:hypothetical protein
LDDLSHADLENLVATLFEQMAEQQRTITALRMRSHGRKAGRAGRIKPSGREKATERSDKPSGEKVASVGGRSRS